MFDTPYIFPTDDFRRFPFWYFVGREFDSFGNPAEKNMLTESFKNVLPDLFETDDLTLLNQILRRKYRDYLVRDHYFVTSKIETIHYTETVKTNFEINFNAPVDITVENLRFATTWGYTVNVLEWSYSFYDKAIGDVGNIKTIQPKSFIFDSQNEQATFKCVVDPSTIENELTWNLIPENQNNPANWVTAWTCQVNCQRIIFPQEYQEDLFNLYIEENNPTIRPMTGNLLLTNNKNLIKSSTWYGVGPNDTKNNIQTVLSAKSNIPAPIDKSAVVYFNLKDDLNLYPEYVQPYGEIKVEPYEGFQYSDKTVFAQQFLIDYVPPVIEKTSTFSFNTTSVLFDNWVKTGGLRDDGYFIPSFDAFITTYTVSNKSADTETPTTTTGSRSISFRSYSTGIAPKTSIKYYQYIPSQTLSTLENSGDVPAWASLIKNSSTETPFNLLTLTITNNTSFVKYSATSTPTITHLRFIPDNVTHTESLAGLPSIAISYSSNSPNVSGTITIPENDNYTYTDKLTFTPKLNDKNYLIFYAPDSPASWTKAGFENLLTENAVWLITPDDPRGQPEYKHIFGIWEITAWDVSDTINWRSTTATPETTYYTESPLDVEGTVEVFPCSVTYQNHKDEEYNLTTGNLYQKEVKVETPLPLKPPENRSEESTSMGLDAEWTKVETFDRTRKETIHKFEPFVDETLKVLENVSIQLAKLHGTEWKAYKKASEVYYSYIVEEGLAHESVKETEQSNGTEKYTPNLKTAKNSTSEQSDNYTTNTTDNSTIESTTNNSTNETTNYSKDTTGNPKETHSGGTRSEVTPTLLQSSTEETSRTANDAYINTNKPNYVPQDKSTVSNTYTAKLQVTDNTDNTVKNFTTDEHEKGQNSTEGTNEGTVNTTNDETINTTNTGTSNITNNSTENTTGTADTATHNAHDRQLTRIRTPWKTIEDVWNNPEYEWLFKVADDIANELFIQSYSF